MGYDRAWLIRDFQTLTPDLDFWLDSSLAHLGPNTGEANLRKKETLALNVDILAKFYANTACIVKVRDVIFQQIIHEVSENELL